MQTADFLINPVNQVVASADRSAPPAVLLIQDYARSDDCRPQKAALFQQVLLRLLFGAEVARCEEGGLRR